ncbi:MAG: flippase-like domain-containing protein [Planctomycetes bacterium]|nr:flippase-like domain-containing protein [Planctomycetota bacterium]
MGPLPTPQRSAMKVRSWLGRGIQMPAASTPAARSPWWLAARLAGAALLIGYLLLALDWSDRVTLGTDARTIDARLSPGDFLVRTAPDGSMLLEETTGGTFVVPEAWRATPPPGVSFHPGIVSTLSAADPRTLAAAGVLVLFIPIVQALRWWRLLRARGFPLGYRRVLRLHWIGSFFNNFVFGMLGGDAARVWLVHRAAPGRLGDAAISVLVDRLLGLIALLLVGSLAGIAMTASHDRGFAVPMRCMLALLAIGAICCCSRAARRFSGIDWLVGWLGRWSRARAAIDGLAAYNHRRGALATGLALSLLGHALLLGACIGAGRAFGIAAPVSDLLLPLSIAFLAGSVPIGLFGVGATEVAAVVLLADLASTNQVVGMMLTVRIAAVAASLPGGWFLARGAQPESAANPAQVT